MSIQKPFLFTFSFFLFITLLFNTKTQSYQEGQNTKILLGTKGEKYFIEPLAKWKTIAQGIDFRKINLYNKLDEIAVQLRIYRLKQALFDIRVICSKHFGPLRNEVKTLSKLTGSIAIINSSYFDYRGNPIGYLKCNKKIFNRRKVTHSLYSGIFFVKQGKPYIVHRSKFFPAKEITDAVQVGPRLLSKGKETVGLKNIHVIHHRSGIALDENENVMIYATSSQYGGISWDTLRSILKLEGIGAKEVLNLDGGGSTQMYISTETFEDYIRGATPVPSAIAFFHKK